MSKTVLVINDELPERCTRCWLVQMELHDAKVQPYCGVAEGPFGGWRTIDVKAESRPDWCPLREMPEYEGEYNYDDTDYFARGWNACLDTLEGKRE